MRGKKYFQETDGWNTEEQRDPLVEVFNEFPSLPLPPKVSQKIVYDKTNKIQENNFS